MDFAQIRWVQCEYRFCLETRKGVTKDLAQAARFYRLAWEGDYPDAKSAYKGVRRFAETINSVIAMSMSIIIALFDFRSIFHAMNNTA
jgi:erythromycin esterase-like protein